MPKEVFGREYRFLPREELLTFEEIERLARTFAAEGVEKIRLTEASPCSAGTSSASSPCSRPSPASTWR
jgi:hypothetical protein